MWEPSQLGILCEQTGDPGQAMIDRMDDKVDDAGTALKMDHTRLGKTLVLPPPFHYNGQWLTCDLTVYPDMYAAFWYHPDHLGSSSYITNLDGEITQHMEYLPFGETLVEEHLNSNNSPYKFNAKELDAETGNYYYGARYYDPKFSIWLSVDPLAEEFPGWSPYNYTMNNPINMMDPNGMAPEKWIKLINGKKQTVYDPKANGGKGGYTKYASAQDIKFGNKLKNSGERGKSRFNHLVNSDTEIEVNFRSDAVVNDIEGYKLGETPANKLKTHVNEEGDLVVDSATIDIYLGTAEEFVSDIKNGSFSTENLNEIQTEDVYTILDNDLSPDDVSTATLGHEIDHTKSRNVHQRRKENKQGGSTGRNNSEFTPQRTTNQILKDLSKKD